MSAAERKSKKIYYTMGEVSEMFDVNPSLIRFWEQKFDILKPDKNKKGNRLFTPADIENLKLIYHLVKENGMTLAGAQKRIKQNREGLGRDLEIVDRLQRIRAMLLEVRQELKGADENVVEIFVDHPSVPAEEHEAGGIPAVRDFVRNGRSGRRPEPGRGRDGGGVGQVLQLPPVARFRNGRIRPDRLYLSGCRSCGLKMNIPNRSVPSWRKPGRLPGVRPMMRMPWQDRWRWRMPWSKRRLRCPGNRKPVLWMPFMRRPLRNRCVRKLSSRRFLIRRLFNPECYAGKSERCRCGDRSVRSVVVAGRVR